MSDALSHQYLSKEKLQRRRTRLLPQASIDSSVESFPASASIRNLCPEPYDQGQIGSCTANATCMAYRLLEQDKSFLPSRLFFYFYERLAEDPKHNPKDLTDSGGDVVDGLTAAKTLGICSETLWPYDAEKLEVVPPSNCQTDAENHKVTSYQKLPLDSTLLSYVKTAIAAKAGILLAIGVYESFQSDQVAQTGVVPLPNPINYEDSNDPQDPFLGGHEVLIVGYDDDAQVLTVLNSWGSSWGDKGFFTLPYAYIANTELTYELVTIAL